RADTLIAGAPNDVAVEDGGNHPASRPVSDDPKGPAVLEQVEPRGDAAVDDIEAVVVPVRLRVALGDIFDPDMLDQNLGIQRVGVRMDPGPAAVPIGAGRVADPNAP